MFNPNSDHDFLAWFDHFPANLQPEHGVSDTDLTALTAANADFRDKSRLVGNAACGRAAVGASFIAFAVAPYALFFMPLGEKPVMTDRGYAKATKVPQGNYCGFVGGALAATESVRLSIEEFAFGGP